ncbi:hypothetical protein EDB83DRAFT_2381501 [Lactarius deliciosus]|nr:hypothetical protein EDB83DRAFT_2381501 [Lactarius deliciosus]
MTQLRTLSLHFLSSHPRTHVSPQAEERLVLPALRRLKYLGTSEYLDYFVARIDAPGLRDIDITFSQPTMDASQLGRFIERIEMQMSLSQAEDTSTPLRLQILCGRLDQQLSSMARICDQFSPILFHVNNIRIVATQSVKNLSAAFGGATDFRVAGELASAVLCALGLVDGGHATVLPSLRHLHIDDPMAMNGPSLNALLSFVTSRSRSGHPIQVNASVSYGQCNICFREQKGLEVHLVDELGYRVLCSYCRDAEFSKGQDESF